MKSKLLVLFMTLAVVMFLPACGLLPASGSVAPAASTAEVNLGYPGLSSGFPTVVAADCGAAPGPTQAADCSGTAYPLPPYGTQVVPTQPDGSLTVTLDNTDETVSLHVGQTFLLNLGEVYNWTVTVADPSILSRKVNVTEIKGAQGIYQALAVGQTVLSAAGDPVCRQSKPACGMPSIMVTFNIVVEP